MATSVGDVGAEPLGTDSSGSVANWSEASYPSWSKWREPPGYPDGGRWGKRGGARNQWYSAMHAARRKGADYVKKWLANNPPPPKTQT